MERAIGRRADAVAYAVALAMEESGVITILQIVVTGIETQKNENNRLRSDNYQLRAQCESQRPP